MFVKLVIVAAAILVASAMTPKARHPAGCPRQKHSYRSRDPAEQHEQLFEDLAADLKALDEKERTFCNNNGNGFSQDKPEYDRFVITTPLIDYSDFDIKIKGRVLSFNAAHEYGMVYHEVKTLPQFIDTTRATYSYDNSNLNIIFPYNNENICNSVLNDDVINVPQYVVSGPRSYYD